MLVLPMSIPNLSFQGEISKISKLFFFIYSSKTLAMIHLFDPDPVTYIYLKQHKCALPWTKGPKLQNTTTNQGLLDFVLS